MYVHTYVHIQYIHNNIIHKYTHVQLIYIRIRINAHKYNVCNEYKLSNNRVSFKCVWCEY